MIKTNMYAAGDYGVMELTYKVMHKEGVRGLLRGWSAAYVRLGKCAKLSRIMSFSRDLFVCL